MVSVVISVLNGAATLANAIQSVREQSYHNVELIVIDGASSDATLDILRGLNHQIDYWLSEPDRGIYDAWNKGVKLATGEWIAFLGSDDRYRPDAVARYIEFIRRSAQSWDYISSRVVEQCTNGLKRTRGTAWNWETFRIYMNVAHFGSFHHKSLFYRFGEFDLSYRIAGDYEFLLRARDTLHAGFVDAITAEVRQGISRSLRSLDEALRAKITTGGRSRRAAHIEHHWARIKAAIRKALGF